jgi:hypothetical protein
MGKKEKTEEEASENENGKIILYMMRVNEH